MLEPSDNDLLELELNACGICRQGSNTFLYTTRGKDTTCALDEALGICCDDLQQMKKEVRSLWDKLGHIADVIIEEPQIVKEPSINNLLFLNTVKRAFYLSLLFTELKEISKSIDLLFDLDISEVNPNYIDTFNDLYMQIRVLHVSICKEVYRSKLIRKALSLNKVAYQTQWGNLVPPLKERVWSWSEDEPYFEERTQARRNQTRYNPEYSKYGIFFQWDEERNAPYRFGDDINSPYPQRSQMSIP